MRATRWRLGEWFFHELLGFQMFGASITPFAIVIRLAISDVRITCTASPDSVPLPVIASVPITSPSITFAQAKQHLCRRS